MITFWHLYGLIRRYFSKSELSNLLTSNFFLVLYYNADIWLIPSLKPQLFQQLLSASSSALRMITLNYDYMISFNQLHSINKRATPKAIMNYKHALLMNNIFNNDLYSTEWLALTSNKTLCSIWINPHSGHFQIKNWQK